MVQLKDLMENNAICEAAHANSENNAGRNKRTAVRWNGHQDASEVFN
jgi:hypothetical protein